MNLYPSAKARGSILIGVVWCVALLSILVVTLLHGVRLELTISKNQADQIQAHYLAVAGIEKAKPLLFQDAQKRSKAGKHYSRAIMENPSDSSNVQFGL